MTPSKEPVSISALKYQLNINAKNCFSIHLGIRHVQTHLSAGSCGLKGQRDRQQKGLRKSPPGLCGVEISMTFGQRFKDIVDVLKIVFFLIAKLDLTSLSMNIYIPAWYLWFWFRFEAFCLLYWSHFSLGWREGKRKTRFSKKPKDNRKWREAPPVGLQPWKPDLFHGEQRGILLAWYL